MKPIFSVVIVTYYHEKYIRDALESVLGQTEINNTEILIGDDGSKDETISILEEYAQKYPLIKVYAHENMGLSKNLFDLLLNAQGDYIAILEGDDYWIDNSKLQKQRMIIDNHSCIGTACNSLIIHEGVSKGLWNKYIKDGLISEKQLLLYQTEICHPSGVMIKNIFKNSGDKFSVIANASKMGGSHSGLINLMFSNGGLYIDTTPMTIWRQVKTEGGKNYSSQKLDAPINYYEGMQKYETYDKTFPINYEMHIYREYRLCKRALKKEFINTVGFARFFFAPLHFLIYRVWRCTRVLFRLTQNEKGANNE